MGPELLIPLLAPIVTEAIKALLKWLFNEVPSTLTPLLSALAGGVMGGAIPMMDSNVIEGIELGLAGVGVHQTARLTGLTKRGKLSRATDRGKVAGIVLLLLLLLPGCANTKEAARLMLHGGMDAACTVAHKSIDVAIGPIQDVEANAVLVMEKAKSLTQ